MNLMFLNFLSSVNSYGQCLTNVPTSVVVESTYSNLNLTGTLWSPDDQCRMIYGVNGSFCHVNFNL